MAETTTPIVFYDIAFKPPLEEWACAPNPWKARYALNFKNVPYSTTWVQVPDIAKVRTSVGCPATRKFADGSDYYTLPMITDSTTKAIVGDSFDIAVYLQQTYPDSGGDLFPVQTLDFVYTSEVLGVPLSECNESSFPEYARFNHQVDRALQAHVGLMGYGMPFDPAHIEEIHNEFIRRSGGMLSSWEDLVVEGEIREHFKDSLQKTLGRLAKLFEKDRSGPFLLGKQASHADFIVGGWLQMMCKCLPEKEWEEVKTWHDGVFGKLHHALQQFAQVCLFDANNRQ